MTDTEKLQAIRAKCVELLEIASKRTAGEWTTRSNTEHTDYGEPIRVESNKPPFSVAYHGSENCFLSSGDATFIAACAGPAEAGWRATIAAIDLCLANIHTDPEFGHDGEVCDNDGRGCRACSYTVSAENQILAAWEGIAEMTDGRSRPDAPNPPKSERL